MLAAMNHRSFVVVYAYIKTEPVQVALFGLVLLGDSISLLMAVAILIATYGVVLTVLRPGSAAGSRASVLGLCSGGLFGLSAVGFRGAILSLGLSDYVMAATFTMVIGLLTQVLLLTAWLWLRQPAIMQAMAAHWRLSTLAGFLGALASQF